MTSESTFDWPELKNLQPRLPPAPVTSSAAKLSQTALKVPKVSLGTDPKIASASGMSTASSVTHLPKPQNKKRYGVAKHSKPVVPQLPQPTRDSGLSGAVASRVFVHSVNVQMSHDVTRLMNRSPSQENAAASEQPQTSRPSNGSTANPPLAPSGSGSNKAGYHFDRTSRPDSGNASKRAAPGKVKEKKEQQSQQQPKTEAPRSGRKEQQYQQVPPSVHQWTFQQAPSMNSSQDDLPPSQIQHPFKLGPVPSGPPTASPRGMVAVHAAQRRNSQMIAKQRRSLPTSVRASPQPQQLDVKAVLKDLSVAKKRLLDARAAVVSAGRECFQRVHDGSAKRVEMDLCADFTSRVQAFMRARRSSLQMRRREAIMHLNYLTTQDASGNSPLTNASTSSLVYPPQAAVAPRRLPAPLDARALSSQQSRQRMMYTPNGNPCMALPISNKRPDTGSTPMGFKPSIHKPIAVLAMPTSSGSMPDMTDAASMPSPTAKRDTATDDSFADSVTVRQLKQLYFDFYDAEAWSLADMATPMLGPVHGVEIPEDLMDDASPSPSQPMTYRDDDDDDDDEQGRDDDEIEESINADTSPEHVYADPTPVRHRYDRLGDNETPQDEAVMTDECDFEVEGEPQR